MDNFFDRTATVDSGDEEEEEFDEETGEPIDRPRKSRPTNGDLDDSSEEDEDDDEEEAQRIREGFIVDDPEDDDEAAERRREKRRKRRREEREDDENLDEEDLDLIGEINPDFDHRQAEQTKFKRLKRGHRDDRAGSEPRGLENIFADEEDGMDTAGISRGRGAYDEMDDFIEQDEFEGEEGGQLDEDMGIRAPRRPGFADLQNLRNSGLDEADLEDMRGAFGDGDEFGWALEAEAEHNEELVDPEKPLELKDVFEPSQLIEKMLTDDDHVIRMNDVPERFQLARRQYKEETDLTDEELVAREDEEARWVAGMLFPKKTKMPPSLRRPFEAAVKTVLHFMNVEDYEPPFIFQNRKDYLIHSEQIPRSPDPNDPGAPDYQVKAEKLLSQTDLWDVFEQDLKFRAFTERRQAIKNSVATLKDAISDFEDPIFDELTPLAAQMDDLQDLQEYLNFQYSGRLKDAALERAETNGLQKRAGNKRSAWDKVRQGPAYHLVRAFGITASQFATNADKSGRRTYTDDPDLRPDDMADTLVRDPDYPTGESVLNAAKAMFVEEIVMNPRVRRHMRQIYYEKLVFDVHRTEKGLKQIDADHPYYEFKYLRNQKVRTMMLDQPETFLRMLKAESEGLVEVRVRLQGERKVREDLQKAIESDNFSEVADAWNALRREVLEVALTQLHKIISKGVKDNIRSECENKLAGYCREAYTQKLDQAPWKPRGMEIGTIARVLALSNGAGNRGDAICWAFVDEFGKTLETGKFADLRFPPMGMESESNKDIDAFVDLVRRREPDVVAVSGWSVETRRLYQDLIEVVSRRDLHGNNHGEDDDEVERGDALEVVMANDEVARLYHTSDRANSDHPGLPPLTRYAIALARYLQNPMKEYAALGRDITSISFDPNQNLVPEDKLLKYLETAMVDMVNLVGVEINEAINDQYTANLLPYVCGLGPRKAAHLLKVSNQNGGEVTTREELVGDVEENKRQAVGPKVWTNCASFLYINYDDNEIGSDYLDNTRIHPEDYDIARKMAADALEMDEEDIKAEVDENGNNAVVRKLVKDGDQDKVNDLLLEQYAEQLEAKFSQKKRATLETIRAELQTPYEELRRPFEILETNEIFTMLTGETKSTLADGMIVPVSIKRTFVDHIDVKLDCGIDGLISKMDYPKDMADGKIEARQVWAPHQTVQAKLVTIDRKRLTATLTLRESDLSVPYKRNFDHDFEEWDDDQEARDKKLLEKTADAGAWRAQRVIKHPLFRPFNARQAEDFLAPQGRGDCVIRPSSNGPDHLAVTWKVNEGMYQHIDVVELNKENEFSVGKILKIGGKYDYTDLDELIVLHVKAMAKKVDEMMGDERYQNGTKANTEQWLTTYTEANPKRSMYAFCLNPKHPGYFYLCFKAGQNAPLSNWPVKVIPNAFELLGYKYPDMQALKNGFKLLFAKQGPGAAANGRR